MAIYLPSIRQPAARNGTLEATTIVFGFRAGGFLKGIQICKQDIFSAKPCARIQSVREKSTRAREKWSSA
jgi:hypothetical protein